MATGGHAAADDPSRIFGGHEYMEKQTMHLWDYVGEAWSILWHKRSLWLFGLLAALGGSGFNFSWRIGEPQPLTELPLGALTMLQHVLVPGDTRTMIVVGLVLGTAMFLLVTLAQGALIDMVGSLQNHREATIKSGLRAGWQYFLPLLAVRFLLALPLLLVGTLAAHSILPALSSLFAEPTGERLFTLGQVSQLAGIGGLVFVISLLVAAIDIGAERAVVLDGKPIGLALLQGVNVLLHNLLDYIAIALSYLVLGVAVGLTFAVVLAPIFFADAFTSLSRGIDELNAFTFTTSALGPLAIVFFVLALIFGTLVTVFTSSVWTIAYHEWESKDRTWALA